MKLIIDMPEEVMKAIQNGEDYRYDIHTAIAQGTSVSTEGDLISRKALKEHKFIIAGTSEPYAKGWNDAIDSIIDNAPTVDAIPNKEGYEMYNKGYMSGYENCKKDVIHSIAKQYSEHNELVPSWLHINIREEGRK